MTWIDPQQPAKPRRRRLPWLFAPPLLVIFAAVAWLIWRSLSISSPADLLPNLSLRRDEPPTETSESAAPTAVATTALAPTAVIPTAVVVREPAYEPPPLLSEGARAALLTAPLEWGREGRASHPYAAAALSHNPYLPFTIIPERPRDTVIQHSVREGETLDSIAARYGLEVETLAWSNNVRYVQVIYPGEEVTVLPVDGVYHIVRGGQTVADIAERYEVEAHDILDSSFNRFATGTTAATPLPSNMRLVVPGGVGEAILWQPTVTIQHGAGSSAGDITGATVAYYGGAGSCGQVVNPGGGAAWVRPMALGTYTWVRGYSLIHSGIDLAAVPGTPVLAANGGRVIFAGWNDYGYGYTIVLAHGPFTTLYGHLSEIYVGCRQDVAPGQIIGGVGNTGNSSGPHLHFEIRYGTDSPQDPSYTFSF